MCEVCSHAFVSHSGDLGSELGLNWELERSGSERVGGDEESKSVTGMSSILSGKVSLVSQG